MYHRRRARKITSVEQIRLYVNKILAWEEYSQEYKAGARSVLVDILHESANYHGFGNIKWLDGGCVKWFADGQPEDHSPYEGLENDVRYF